MPRRAVLTKAHRDALLALPTVEGELVRHWTLSPEDLAIIARRRRPANRLGFALQLCALRHPGRLLRPGELIPEPALTFIADQLEVSPDDLADYAVRGPTRYEQLSTLRTVFGFFELSQPHQREIQACPDERRAAILRPRASPARRRRPASEFPLGQPC